ncbi:hypothetical protein NPIL_204391 [Nephila pilipes]|uniref:Uncharacterized protein n=1 Tax=Nephila pilipes TaxID=299642 RepID=A0A8X6PCH1_NEPPI|nr:hypothetical protein NPIL_204391 [Nephila pilipes]
MLVIICSCAPHPDALFSSSPCIGRRKKKEETDRREGAEDVFHPSTYRGTGYHDKRRFSFSNGSDSSCNEIGSSQHESQEYILNANTVIPVIGDADSELMAANSIRIYALVCTVGPQEAYRTKGYFTLHTYADTNREEEN